MRSRVTGVLERCAAAFAAALFAHAVLQRIADAGLGAAAFESHAHGTVAPAMAVLALLFIFGSTSFVVDAMRTRTFVVLARGGSLGAARLCGYASTIACVAAVTLCCMERAESSAAFTGFAWLGGNAFLGLAVLAVATLAATLVFKVAHDVRRVALDRAIGLLSKIFYAIAVRVRTAGEHRSHRRAPSVRARVIHAGRSTALRAPPLPTV